MNSRLRLGPPKQMLATISGTAVGLDDDVIGRVEPLAAGLQRPGANTAAAIQVGWTIPPGDSAADVPVITEAGEAAEAPISPGGQQRRELVAGRLRLTATTRQFS